MLRTLSGMTEDMFDLSLGEILLVAAIAVIFIGPKELPGALKAIARALAYLRALARELRQAFDALLKESGLQDATREIERETRMIMGDDGKLYESYDVSGLLEPPSQPAHDKTP